MGSPSTRRMDGRLAVTDEDPHAPGVRYVKFWVDDAAGHHTGNFSDDDCHRHRTWHDLKSRVIQ